MGEQACNHRRKVLVHYDVREESAATRKRVERYLFGYPVRARNGGRVAVHRHPGVVDGVRAHWIGESVVLMTPGEPDRFAAKLRDWSVQHARLDVLLP